MLTLATTFPHPSRFQVAIPGMFDLTSDSLTFSPRNPLNSSISFMKYWEYLNSYFRCFAVWCSGQLFWEWRLKGVQLSNHCNTTRLGYYILIKRRKQCLMILNHFVVHCRDGMIKIWSIFLEVQSTKFHSIHCKHFLMKHFCYFATHWNCYSH